MPLLVETQGVDGLKEHLQQELQTDLLRVVLHADRLGKACRVGIYFLVRRVLRMSVGKTDLRRRHSLNLFEVMLCSPEASSCKINLLRHIRNCLFPIVFL